MHVRVLDLDGALTPQHQLHRSYGPAVHDARAWGREAELAALVRKLHHEKANVLLVGESGVGKTTLMVDAVKEAEKLALAEDEERRVKHKRRFWLSRFTTLLRSSPTSLMSSSML